MTYMDHVPAQKRAASYLQHVMKEFPKGRFLVAGHSKGGNLATYACSYLPDSLFEWVDAIYSYDAPGLNKAIIETEVTSGRPQTFVALSLRDPSLA